MKILMIKKMATKKYIVMPYKTMDSGRFPVNKYANLPNDLGKIGA